MGGLLNPFTFHTIYDALNRVTNRNYSTPNGVPANYQATPNVVYTYDDKPNAKGLLTKISNGVSTTEYTEFDILGRVKAHKQTTDGQSYTTGYVYNFSGAMIEQTYPSGRVVKNVLDNDGQLSMVQSKKNANFGFWNYADSFTYTAAGAVSSMQLGNGKWESTQFNSRLQPTQIALGTVQNSTDKLKLNFTYNTPGLADNNGNVLSQTITVPTEVRSNITYNGFTANQAYIYDSLNRIEQATETVSGQTGNNWQQTFEYDRYGNRTFDELNTTTLPKNCVNGIQQPVVCANMVAQVNPTANTGNNRLNGYTFDASGNTILDAQSRKFTYDGENKQVKVETVDGNGNPVNTIGIYEYDGDGKRVKKISATEITIFVYNASGQLAAEYSTQLSQAPQVSYLTSDHLGSPRINTDENGKVTARHDLQPFGEEIQRPSYGTDDVRQKFTSYERDNETDLDFAQARMYSTKLGRFTAVDPILITSVRLLDPQRISLYAYVRNNPTKYKDPNGKDIVLGTQDKSEQKVLKQALVELAKTKSGQEFLSKLDKSDVVFSLTVGKAIGTDRRQRETYERENYGKTDRSKLEGLGETAKGTIVIEINTALIKKDGEDNKKVEDFNKSLGDHAKAGGKPLPFPEAPQGKNDAERNATVVGHELNDANEIVNTGRAPADTVSTGAARSMIEDKNKAKDAEKFVDDLIKPKNP